MSGQSWCSQCGTRDRCSHTIGGREAAVWNYQTARDEIKAAGPWTSSTIGARVEQAKLEHYRAEMRLKAAKQMQAHLKQGGDTDCSRCGGYGWRDDGFLGDPHPCECNREVHT